MLGRNIVRMWVNAPSTLQLDHKYSGINVLADLDSKRHVDRNGVNDYLVECYMISGDITSIELWFSTLSEGWHKHPFRTMVGDKAVVN